MDTQTSKKDFLPRMIQRSVGKLKTESTSPLQGSFDSTGQFYSCRTETVDNHTDPLNYFVFTCQHSEDLNLQLSTIKLTAGSLWEKLNEVYDPYTTRWFLTTTLYSVLAEIGTTTTLYSGCLRNHFGN